MEELDQYDAPDQCYNCGRHAQPGEVFTPVQVEMNRSYMDGQLTEVRYCAGCVPLTAEDKEFVVATV